MVAKPPEWAPLTASACSPTSPARPGCPTACSTSCRAWARRRARRSPAHPDPAGSRSPARSPTGRLIAAAAAAQLDPGVAGAGRQVAAAGVRRRRPGPGRRHAVGQYDNAGQVCLAGTRLLVEERVAEEFTRARSSARGRPGAGRPAGRGDRHRPELSPARTSTGSTASSSGRSPAGAAPLLGGRSNPGPRRAVLPPDAAGRRGAGRGDPHRGGVRPGAHVQTFTGEDEAVALANSTPYGLAATMFTGDTSRAERVSARLRRGHRVGQLLLRPRPAARRSAAPGCPASAGRAAPGASTSTRRQEHRLRPGQGWQPVRTAMGEVVGAGLLAHVPTIMLPYEQRLRAERGQGDQPGPGPAAAAGRGLRDAGLRHGRGARLALAHHRRVRRGRPARCGPGCSPPTSCRAGCAGSPTTGSGDPELAHAIAGQADPHGTWITAIDDPYLPVHYATVNLWHYLGRGLASGGSR